MGFDAGSAFSEAFERITTQVAVLVVGLYAVASIVQTAAIQDIVREVIEAIREVAQDELDPEEYQEFLDATDSALEELPLALGLELVPAILLLLVATFAGTAVVALAIDAFARRATDVDELDTSRLLWNTVHILVGGIAYFLLVTIGSLFFFIPGLVVFVLFVFYPVAIVVEETNFVSAFGRSLDTVTDNVGHTLLVVLLAIVVGVAGGVLSTVATAAVGGAVGGVISTTINAAATMVVLAMLTRAYVAANPEAPTAVAADDPAAEEI